MISGRSTLKTARSVLVNVGLVYFLTTSTEYIVASRHIGSRYDFFFVFKVLIVTAVSLLLVEVLDRRYDVHVVLIAAIYAIFISAGYYFVKLHDINIKAFTRFF